MSSSGGSPTSLTTDGVIKKYPSWSPDGSRIVFVRGTGSGSEIYVMNSDGSNLTQLTNNSSRDGYPCWTPDGSKIIFHSDIENIPYYDIWIMNPDGSDKKIIIKDAAFPSCSK